MNSLQKMLAEVAELQQYLDEKVSCIENLLRVYGYKGFKFKKVQDKEGNVFWTANKKEGEKKLVMKVGTTLYKAISKIDNYEKKQS